MARYLGVDGCPGGWYAVWQEGVLKAEIYPSIAALHGDHPDAEKVLIDIPIGLMESEPRLLEAEVRKRLGSRRSSVFSVPCYAAVYATDYDKANQLNREHLGQGLSKQAWFICPKIRDVNDYIEAGGATHSVFGECHPELAFAQLAGVPQAHNKKSEQGRLDRLQVLNTCLAGVDAFVEQQMQQFKRKELNLDDCLDALALLVTAQRAEPLNISIEQFGKGGVPIQMWVPTHK